MTTKTKKILSLFIKCCVILLVFWFVYQKLSANDNLLNFKNLLKSKEQTEIYTVIGVVFLLMFVNWFLEAAKWQRMVKHIERISFYRAIESVFCGLTLAIFTPNRLGEYGGRVFFLSPKRRIVGVVAMTVGNIGQLVLTNVFGAISLYVFALRFLDIRNLHASVEPLLFIATVVFCVFFIVFYFNIRWLNKLLLQIKFTRKYEKFYSILARYSKAELFRILLFCLARYIVFTSQYFILFLWLIPGLHFFDVLVMICILFFVQSTLPSLDLFDVGVRAFTGAFFFQYITNQSVAVIGCIACIWFTNIIIPAILGTYFVFKLNFFGNSKTN
ncbi:hypothetical protein [Pedobacter sp. MW01-1-1]|uniref:hypothetical protein n=1 Tax=Pedobacter sp. MW01-1-1 TaxID=3383027 RepID=UPI003FEF1EF0